jgi:hypothetical protein
VQVVRGVPDDVELAALVAGLVAAASEATGETDAAADGPVSAWNDRRRTLRAGATPAPARDAWRWSLRG